MEAGRCRGDEDGEDALGPACRDTHTHSHTHAQAKTRRCPSLLQPAAVRTSGEGPDVQETFQSFLSWKASAERSWATVTGLCGEGEGRGGSEADEAEVLPCLSSLKLSLVINCNQEWNSSGVF